MTAKEENGKGGSTTDEYSEMKSIRGVYSVVETEAVLCGVCPVEFHR